MSWNLTFTSRNKGAAQKHVEEAVKRGECPAVIGDGIIAHIEAFPIPEGKVLVVEAQGHTDHYYGTADLRIRLHQRADTPEPQP